MIEWNLTVSHNQLPFETLRTMGDKFHLTWRDYQTNVSKTFGSLRHEDNLNDVTLVSDDNVQVSAHKVVLSSCSGYFKEIFIKNKHSHPMLCLIGVKSQDVNHVLDYIYHGEVQIHQDNLDAFLEVAQKFQLEGLRGQTENKTKVDEVDDFKTDLNQVEMPSFTYENKLVSQPREYKNTVSLSDHTLVSEMFSSIEELDSRIDQEIFRTSYGAWQCGRCPKIAKNKGHIKEHFEKHIEGLSFPCKFCDKVYRSRYSLRQHDLKTHRK